MDVDLQYGLGLAAYEAGHFNEAAFHLEEVSKHRPEDPLAMMRFGNALKHVGRFARAAEVPAELVSAYPHAPKTWSNLGATYLAWGPVDEASPLFERAVGLMPESAELSRLTAALRQVNGELWEIEDAIRTCEREGNFGLSFIALARSVYYKNDTPSWLVIEAYPVGVAVSG